MSSPRPDGIGQSLAGSLTLTRPDGEELPADANDLAAPPPPRADKGLIATDIPGSTEGTIKRLQGDVRVDDLKQVGAQLVGITESAKVESVGTTDTITLAEGTRRAADGESFLVARVSFDTGPWFPPIPASLEHKNVTLVVSAPKEAADVQLVMTTAGKEQPLSLATGKPATATLAFDEVDLNQHYATANYEVGRDFFYSHSTLFTKAILTHFEPYRGWAPAGKTWLILQTDQDRYDWDFAQYRVRRDEARSLSVTDEHGTQFRNSNQSETAFGPAFVDLPYPVLAVDENSRTFTVVYQPSFTFVAHVPLAEPKTGSGTLKKLSFKVAFQR